MSELAQFVLVIKNKIWSMTKEKKQDDEHARNQHTK